ncbi:MAG: single-stranded DNA-binding protein [Clostridiales bacterium]|nr:single-stranded DNA-binding protein [Clostridiales bacterium]
MATITVTGRLTSDAELKFLSNGTPVLRFSIACNRWKIKENKTSFYDCEVWGRYGEGKSKVINKGTHVIVTGSLDIDEFEGRSGKVKKPIITVSVVEPTPGQTAGRASVQSDSQRFDSGPENFDDDIPF